MKMILARIMPVCLIASMAFAQETTLSIFGGFGYGFGMGGLLISAANGNLDEDQYLNQGQGIKFEAGAELFPLEKVGVQMGIEYSWGVPAFNTDNNITFPGLNALVGPTEMRRSMFGIKASVVPRFEILELLDMYTGVGIGLYWSTINYDITLQSGTATQAAAGKIESAPALAFLGKLGADLPLSDMMMLYSEIAFEEMTFRWKRIHVSESSIPTLLPQEIVFEEDASNAPAPLKVSGSNWQIRIGMRFNLF